MERFEEKFFNLSPNSLSAASQELSERSHLKSGSSILDGELPQDVKWWKGLSPLAEGISIDSIPDSADRMFSKKSKGGKEKPKKGNLKEAPQSEVKTPKVKAPRSEE